LEELPLIEPFVDRGGVFLQSCLDVLREIEADGIVQIDRASPDG
jgi:hypothetical protein